MQEIIHSIFKCSISQALANLSTYGEQFWEVGWKCGWKNKTWKMYMRSPTLVWIWSKTTFTVHLNAEWEKNVVRRQDSRCVLVVVCMVVCISNSLRTKTTRGSHGGFTLNVALKSLVDRIARSPNIRERMRLGTGERGVTKFVHM